MKRFHFETRMAEDFEAMPAWEVHVANSRKEAIELMNKDWDGFDYIILDERVEEITNKNEESVEMMNAKVDVKVMEKLEGKTMEQLKDICKMVGLKGYSKFNKGSLIEFMRNNIKTEEVNVMDKTNKEVATTTTKKNTGRFTAAQLEAMRQEAMNKGEVVTINKREKGDGNVKKSNKKVDIVGLLESANRVIAFNNAKWYSAKQMKLFRSQQLEGDSFKDYGVELNEKEFFVGLLGKTKGLMGYVCNEEGITHKLNSKDGKVEILWEKGMKAPKAKVTVNKEDIKNYDWKGFLVEDVLGKIRIGVSGNLISGNLKFKEGEEVVDVAFRYNSKKYNVPEVRFNGKRVDKEERARLQKLVLQFIAAYRDYLKGAFSNKEEASSASKEAAITKVENENSVKNNKSSEKSTTSKKSRKSMYK